MLAEFFRDKTPPRLLMIAALLLMAVSQFFFYFDDPGTGFLSIDSDWNTVGHYWLGQQGTGWDLHPQAYVIVVALAFALLRDDIAEHRAFRRFGYWLCVVLFFIATTPGAPLRATGAGMGGIALLMALAAAFWHQFGSSRSTAPGS